MRTLLCFAFVVAFALPADAADTGSDVSAPPPPAVSPMKKARGAIARKQWAASLPLLDAELRQNPRNADAYNLMGYATRHLGRYEESLRHYRKALQLDPKHRGAHEYLGELYLRIKRPEKARAHLKHLEKLCPSGCEERSELAEALEN